MLSGPHSRRVLPGLGLLGLILSFPGAILLSWGYHLHGSFRMAGLAFLAMDAGLIGSLPLARRLLKLRGVTAALFAGSLLASAAFLYLGLLYVVPATESYAAWWRLPGLVIMGFAAGLLHASVGEALAEANPAHRAAAIHLFGAVFGVSCLLTVILIAETIYVYTIPSMFILLAVIAGFAAVDYGKNRKIQVFPAVAHEPVWSNLTSPAALLFSALLMIQFGNEWSIAGWLPVYLTRRLGISPVSALWLLAVYWLALLTGRILSRPLLTRLPGARLLSIALGSALLGYLILSFTAGEFGAAAGVVLVGLGYAPIFPIVADKIGGRFPSGSPHGVFLLALSGGLLAPALLGFLAEWRDIGIFVQGPLLGTLVSFLLVVVIALENRWNRTMAPAQ